MVPRDILALLRVAILLVVGCQGICPPLPAEPVEQANKPICEMENSTSVAAVLFLPKSNRLVQGGGYVFGPGELTFCEATTLKSILVRKDHKLAIWALAASPDGSKVATGGGYGEVKVYDAKSGDVLADLNASGKDRDGCYTNALAFSSDGRLLASGACAVVKLWDMKTMKELVSVPGVETAPHGLAFSPDDKFLVFNDWKAIRFWDVEKGREAFKIPKNASSINDSKLLFTPDGKSLIYSCDDEDLSLIHVWDLEQKKETRVFKGHTRFLSGNEVAVIALTLDREGKYLISGGGDETVRIWDLASGKQLVCLTGNKAIIRGLAVSAGNKYLVACSDKLIRVWDLQKLLKDASK